MRPPLVYLFDIDGTLISSPRGVGRRALERACADVMGMERALESVVLHGNTDPFILDEAFVARLGRLPTDAERERVLGAYVERLAVELEPEESVRVLPAVAEAIAAVERAGALIGLATGNIEAGARLKLGRVGLWGHFPFGGFGSDAPDRAELVRVAVRRASERAGRALGGDEVVVIGDTPRDIAAARAAGVRSVGVATGAHDAATLAAAGADEVHHTLASLTFTQ